MFLVEVEFLVGSDWRSEYEIGEEKHYYDIGEEKHIKGFVNRLNFVPPKFIDQSLNCKVMYVEVVSLRM